MANRDADPQAEANGTRSQSDQQPQQTEEGLQAARDDDGEDGGAGAGLVELRAGMFVEAGDADEARFIYDEIFVQRCYVLEHWYAMRKSCRLYTRSHGLCHSCSLMYVKQECLDVSGLHASGELVA